LLKELNKEFSIVAVAPDSEKSWIGKSISARSNLIVKEVQLNGSKIFACSGTPADCIQIGIYNFLKDKPKLVVSGINIGENVGHGRILSSGTIGAAMEASIDGIKAISTSLYIPPDFKKNTDFFDEKNYFLFENAAKITLKIIKIILNHKFDEDIDLISINIPFDATIDSPFMITKPFRDPYGKLFHKKGDNYIHISPTLRFENLKEGTDLKALSENKISITPISLELVSKNSFNKLNQLISKSW
jgi:5'-nucleotidase